MARVLIFRASDGFFAADDSTDVVRDHSCGTSRIQDGACREATSPAIPETPRVARQLRKPLLHDRVAFLGTDVVKGLAIAAVIAGIAAGIVSGLVWAQRFALAADQDRHATEELIATFEGRLGLADYSPHANRRAVAETVQ